YVRRDPKRPRAIEVVNPFEEEEAERAKFEELSNNTVQVPVVGRIAAGGPILAEQEVDDVFSLPTQVVGSGEMFLLKVIGDSMIDAAICHDDWVVVRKQHTADNGQIVAALLDGEATVKTLKRKAGHQWLLPQHENYESTDRPSAQIISLDVTVNRLLCPAPVSPSKGPGAVSVRLVRAPLSCPNAIARDLFGLGLSLIPAAPRAPCGLRHRATTH